MITKKVEKAVIDDKVLENIAKQVYKAMEESIPQNVSDPR